MGCLRNKDIFRLTLLFSLFIFINLAVSFITSLISPRAVWDKHRNSAECVESEVESREYERIDNDNSANQAYPINSENNGKYLY